MSSPTDYGGAASTNRSAYKTPYANLRPNHKLVVQALNSRIMTTLGISLKLPDADKLSWLVRDLMPAAQRHCKTKAEIELIDLKMQACLDGMKHATTQRDKAKAVYKKMIKGTPSSNARAAGHNLLQRFAYFNRVLDEFKSAYEQMRKQKLVLERKERRQNTVVENLKTKLSGML